MKKVIASAGLLALGAVAVHDARADWAAGADKPWSLSGTLRGFYDDNINTQPDGTGRESSFGFDLSPSIQTSLSSGSTTFTGSYTYDLLYYSNRTPNHFDQSHDLELFMNHNFNERYSLDFEESFVDSQEPTVLNGGGVERVNGDNFHNAVGFHFTDQVTELWSLVFGYSNNFYDYTGNLPTALANSPTYATLLNRFEDLVTLNARWQVAEETTLVFGYNFDAINFFQGGSLGGKPISILNPYIPSSSKDDFSHYIYAGVDHNFRSDLSMSVRAGVQIADYYNYKNAQLAGGTEPGELSPYASISLNYTYMDGGILTLGFIHAKTESDAGLDQLGSTLSPDQESSTVSASVIQTLTPLSPDLTATLTASYENSPFNGGTFGAEGLADNFYSVGFNLSYQFTHNFSAEAGYNYDELSSQVLQIQNPEQRSYNRNRVYIGVTATY